MVKQIPLLTASGSIPCQTVYSVGYDKPNRYACYSRWRGDEQKTTFYFRTHVKSGLTKEELDWFLEKVIPELVTPEYLKACKISELTQDEWLPLTEQISKNNVWDLHAFEKDVPWIKVVVKPKPGQTRTAWFALLTFLREPQEYPQHVKAAYRAYKNGLPVSSAWALSYLYQLSSGHSALACQYYRESFVEDIKQYSLKDKFKECAKRTDRASLNDIFGFKGQYYSGTCNSVLKALMNSDEAQEFVHLAWEPGHTEWILDYSGLKGDGY